jgi:hypothetical protein
MGKFVFHHLSETVDSIFNFINWERLSTNSERNSFTSVVKLAIVNTFVQNVCISDHDNSQKNKKNDKTNFSPHRRR